MGNRKNIALYIGMLETEFTRGVCEGALLAAQEIDANVVILPGGFIDADYSDKDFDEYRRQYNILYSYASVCSFDAIVLEYGTITSALDETKKKELLQQMGDVPVVLLASEVDGYSSICIDNKAGIRDAVTHLIKYHECTKIGFVSGPKTSQDANERLQAYRETMQEYHIDVPEQWIAYGNFSEYCTEQIDEFIAKNQDLEAIVFANDQMAQCAYNVMKKYQLKPRDDIRMIGFDDNPVAMLMDPPLSSVKLDPKELGYRAVMACPDVIAGKEIHQRLAPKLITRESCGCDNSKFIDKAVESMLREDKETLLQHLTGDMLSKYFDVYFDNEDKVRICKTLEEYFKYYFYIAKDDGSIDLNATEFVKEYRKYMQLCQMGYIDIKEFMAMDQLLCEYLRRQIYDKDDLLQLLEQVLLLRNELIGTIKTQDIIANEKSKIYEPIMASIVSDMLYCSRNEQKIFKTVTDKFKKMNFASSCIIMYDNEIKVLSEKKWILPEHFFVIACQKHDDVQLFEWAEKEIDIAGIFTSQWLPTDHRFDVLAIPLFSNQMQYGLLLMESDVQSIQYALEMACQISVALEVIQILKRQNEIKNELESNLAQTIETNRLLDEMSRKDPLTGILNRRGFLDYVKKIACDKKNYGKKAIAVYADMDNLKVINDEFGHEEGDYSLKLIAKALSESFRQSDIVARMGGDEFAAFAVIGEENCSKKIKERIHSILSTLNKDDGKIYYVNASVGIAEFVIDEDFNIEHILTEADKDLYIEKRNKKKIVYK